MARKTHGNRRKKKPDPSLPGASRRSIFWRWRRPLFFLGVIVLASVVGVLWVASQVQIPNTNPIVDQTSFICAANVTTNCNESDALASLHGNVNRVVVPLSKVSPEMQGAVLAAEDKDFFKHGGVDPVGIARAAVIDIRGGSTTHGGSTLTQQYVKLTYLTSERTFSRKIKEAILSVKLEQQLSKKQIFERYLNLVYFGRGAYGVQAAAQSYFGVDASRLTLPQATYLAGIIRNPSWATDTAKATSLRQVVLGNMYADHMIDANQRAAAEAAPLGVVPYQPSVGVNWLGGPLGSATTDPYGSQYFTRAVINDLIDKLGKDEVFNGGLRIYTTLEPKRQEQAYQAVTSVLDFPNHPAGALVAIDNQGKVVAMMGGTDFATSKFNLATGAGPQPGRPIGSTFKAFALAQLVKSGYSITSSVPAQFKTTFSAKDYPVLKGQPDGKWTVFSDCCSSGATTVVDATAQSINSSYAQIMLDLGPENVDRMAHELGVSTAFESTIAGKPQHLASYVLGTQNIPVVDVADAYSTFARNGVHIDATMVNRVVDRSGNELASFVPERSQVLTPSENAKVVYALQQVVQHGTGTSAQIGRPAAGKTGTVGADGLNSDGDGPASANKDAMFTGFVPGLTASVWMGYVDNSVMPASFQGASYPAAIWKRFMEAALAGTTPRNFPTSGDLSAGTFLTSWGGSRYLAPAWDVKAYSNGVGNASRGDSSSGSSTGSWHQTHSSTTIASGGSGPGRGTGGSSPPSSAPATTAAPPPTPPPATGPPVTPPATVPSSPP